MQIWILLNISKLRLSLKNFGAREFDDFKCLINIYEKKISLVFTNIYSFLFNIY